MAIIGEKNTLPYHNPFHIWVNTGHFIILNHFSNKIDSNDKYPSGEIKSSFPLKAPL